MMHLNQVVHSDPDILGGTSVFVGTRVPVRTRPDHNGSWHRQLNLAIIAIYVSLYGHHAKDDVMQVNILEAKNRLSRLIKSVQAGEEVVIANRGEPVARLVPARETPAASASKGSARAILLWLENKSLPDYARRSSEEIDAAIEEERHSWD